MSSDPPSRLGRGLIVISGPSGVGKSSICKAVLERLPGAVWSVSATTRPIRADDRPGETYEFITEEEFRRREVEGRFLESAVYCGYHYGTPRPPVEQALSEGRIVIMEIDVQGTRQVAEKMPLSTRIFVLPPTAESLRLRLEGRRTEQEQSLARRLARADGEIAFARDSGVYQYFVVNDDLEESIRKVLDIIHRETVETS